MADLPKACPRCKIAWSNPFNLRVIAEAKAAENGRPAKPARWYCDACYSSGDIESEPKP